MKKKKIFITSLIVFSVLLGLDNFSSVRSETDNNIQKAVDYIKSQPQTPWSTMALSAAGATGIDLDYLKFVPEGQKSAATYATYILALSAAGKNPAVFGNENYVESLKNYYQNNQFGDEKYINDDIWAILALGSVGKEYLPQSQGAKQFILDNQNDDGGWGFGQKGNSSGADMTAVAIIALLESGVKPGDAAINKAKNYLKSIQNSDGGFPGWTQESSVSSSAWVISAIYKLGEDPASWLKDGKNPLENLISLQDSEKGFFYDTKGGAGEDAFVKTRTSYAVISLFGATYPIFSVYNLHHLRIEGSDNTICDKDVNGQTPLDLIIEAAKLCNFNYALQYYESFDSLLLTEINSQPNWEYKVNNILASVGADNYYLDFGEEVLWYGVGSLWGTWLSLKTELTKTDNLGSVQVKYYNQELKNWQNLEKEGIKVKIGTEEFLTDNSGIISFNVNNFSDGIYQVFSEHQIIGDTGYIRSEKIDLKVGEVPLGHQAGLKVEIEKIKVPQGGEQTAIGFSVSPDTLDFGKLKPGEGAVRDLIIANGESEIYLEAEVTGHSVFQENLNIAENFWQIFSAELASKENRTLPIKLTVPSDYNGDFGEKQGEIIFWAIKK
ncbi:MAG: prenyltransferase/squalene oxidase repeat-containing protein [Patescibacteria group bacterium]